MQNVLTKSPDIRLFKEDRFIDLNGSVVNYNVKNPISKLMGAMEEAYFFAEELNCYLTDSLQFLFPFSHLDIYGPSGSDHSILNPEIQDNKTDFQKQNIKDFILTDTFMVRGWVNVGERYRPFLKVSYTGGPDSILSEASGNKLDSFIYLWLKVQNNQASDLIKVPYNEATNRYEIEIWGYPDGNDLFNRLSEKGKSFMKSGNLIVRNDLIRGSKNDFDREGLDDKNMYQQAPDNTMHPLLPLKIELAWADHTKKFWDSQQGKNYHFEFNMILRGWDNFMQVGVSANPHGGIGFLHYRNLLSNYKPYTVPSELSRTVMPWMFDASGNKSSDGTTREERSLAVDYMDLHILKPDCGIGIHRHRDNQEVFFLLTGKSYMMVGDWYKFPDRERAFEIRTLVPGSFSLLKPGQLHSLINALDIEAVLLMFGGYD
jgi:mannose-6-phosphate isomerase-like protein (cupin superfamily)